MTRKVSAIVLAAGSSKRMGTLKQLLSFGSKTLLETTLDAVKESNVSETILVLGHRAEEIQSRIRDGYTTILVVNPAYEEGMSTSIQTGIRAVSPESSAVLIVLGDQPFLKGSVINSLIDAYQTADAKILLPVYKGFRGNPVLIDRSLFPEMMQLTGDIGCRSLFGPRPDQILKVNVEDVGILIDIDSSEDLAKFSGTNVSNVEMKDLDLKDRKAPEQQRCLIIVGSDQITFALARLGKMMNFRVTIVDPLLTRVELSETDSIVNELDLKKAGANDRCYIVVASRGRFDEEALQQAASHGACYIALVGSKKRGIEIIQRLSISEEMRKRIHCPAGLEIHAETPEEIALSVMAQIVQEDRSLARE